MSIYSRQFKQLITLRDCFDARAVGLSSVYVPEQLDGAGKDTPSNIVIT
jgi:hypothetical protein